MDSRLLELRRLHVGIEKCKQCVLHKNRINVVSGTGHFDPRVVFVGEAPGSEEDKTGFPFCLHKNHKVLMADFSWKDLSDIKIGDKIIAPDEFGQTLNNGSASNKGLRRWRIAAVTNKTNSVKFCKKIETNRGILIATPDHRILSCNSSKKKQWLKINQLVCGEQHKSGISHVFYPWRKRFDFESGWVSGFFDGEGTVMSKKSKGNFGISYSQNIGIVSEYCKKILKKYNYKLGLYSKSKYKRSICEVIKINGGIQETFRFLGEFNPIRLVKNVINCITTNPPSVYSYKAEVISITDYGKTDVVDITTTTGTFVADGFIVHNCGESGLILHRWIDELRLLDTDFAILNIVKCHPPNNRDPMDEEITTCTELWLEKQLKILNPEIIVSVGRLASAYFLGKEFKSGILTYAGRFHGKTYCLPHPAYFLRRGSKQNEWEPYLIKLKEKLLWTKN